MAEQRLVEDVDGKLVPAPKRAAPVARDAFVVCTEPLSGLVCGFVDRWHAERPPTNGQFATGDTRVEGTLSAIQYLEEKTQLPRKAIASVTTRDEDGRPCGRSATTELRVADALVAAIGSPEAFSNGTLRVFERSEARRGCCGGLNGSLA